MFYGQRNISNRQAHDGTVEATIFALHARTPPATTNITPPIQLVSSSVLFVGFVLICFTLFMCSFILIVLLFLPSDLCIFVGYCLLYNILLNCSLVIHPTLVNSCVSFHS